MISPRRRIWRVVRIVWVTLGVASVAGLFWGMGATALPGDTFVSTDRVEVVRATDTIDFRPRPDDPSRAGLLFFPGALVDPDAYAPMARQLAERGHRAIIVKLPFRMAPTAGYEAMAFQTVSETMAAAPRPWVVGGHSRGGMLATRFAAGHPDRLAGLALVATTHPRELNLAWLDVPVLKVYGANDGMATPEEVRRFAGLLPDDTRFVEVAGGTHRGFAYYRFQLMDGRAEVSREDQVRQLVEAVAELLEQVGGLE